MAMAPDSGFPPDQAASQDQAELVLQTLKGLPQLGPRTLQLLSQSTLNHPEVLELVGLLRHHFRYEAITGTMGGAGRAPTVPRALPHSHCLSGLWRHSYSVACTAEAICGPLECTDLQGAAFTGGLLHDIGKIAMALVMPKAFARILSRIRRFHVSQRQAECAVLGLDHTRLGKHLLEHLRLPAGWIECAWLHHVEFGLLQALAGSPELVGIVQAANMLVHRTEASHSGIGPSQSMEESPLLAKLDSAFLSELETRLRERVSTMEAPPPTRIGGAFEDHGAIPPIDGATELHPNKARHPTLADDAGQKDRDPHAETGRTKRSSIAVHERLVSECTELAEKRARMVRQQCLSMVSEMAAGAAHELNNPLAVISGRAQMALTRATDPEELRSMKIILEHANRASNLISDLMRAVKPETPRPVELRLADVLSTVALRCRNVSALGERELTLSVLDDQALVYADPDQLDELLDALLANSVRACKPGSVRVKINSPSLASDVTARVVIEDRGTGMSETTLEYAAVPFFSSRPAGRGRGLGLSRATRLIEVNGGSWQLDSTPDAGTRILVELPARRGTADSKS